jgi:hypothetical protein
MSSLTQKYSKKSSLKVRPMSEWQGLMVLAPEQPNVYLLNNSSGVVLELCDGRTGEAAKHDFIELLSGQVGAEEANRLFDEGLSLLEEKGLVDRFD